MRQVWEGNGAFSASIARTSRCCAREATSATATAPDIKLELTRYGRKCSPATRFRHAKCSCGGTGFRLELDEETGVARRSCARCKEAHVLADGEEFLDEASADECACPCGGEIFQVRTGVALYRGSTDVKWLYVGARCVGCGLTACYGDWKNEAGLAAELLANV